MLILGIESSGLVASVALVENGLLKAEYTINNRMTHSETLLPMLEHMMEMAGSRVSDVDAIAVSAGPGSFTGLRIGAATAKGLALAADKPIVAVSSLDALAYNLGFCSDTIVCPIMDARRGQVYCAAYRRGFTLIEPSAMPIHEFIEKLNELDTEVESEDGGFVEISEFAFLGDGVPVYEQIIAEEIGGEYYFVTAENNRQRAASVAQLGTKLYQRWLNTTAPDYDETVMNSDDFAPDYLRKPQAEREKDAGLLEDPGQHSLSKMK